jgi:hypothetical protein
MAAAQVWKVANTVDDRVRELLITMLSVDNRVAYIDDGVPAIDTLHSIIRVEGINDRVKVVDDKVGAVDDKVAAVVDDGAQYVVYQSS